MPIYFVPVTIVEHERSARVEATSPAEARQKARAAEWEDLGDAARFTVRVSGPARKQADA
jgi:hypothetical protein